MIPVTSRYAPSEPDNARLQSVSTQPGHEAVAKTAAVLAWIRAFSKSKSQLELREISWRDLPAILAIERASFSHPWSLFDFLRFKLKPNTSGRVRVIEGKVVGYLLYEKHKDRLHIAHVAVKPECRSMGLGREMIRSLGDRARRYVTLYVRKSNVKAQRLYHNLGFTVVRELPHHYGDCEDAFLMGYSGPAD